MHCAELSKELKQHVKNCSKCYINDMGSVSLCVRGIEMQQSERKKKYLP